MIFWFVFSALEVDDENLLLSNHQMSRSDTASIVANKIIICAHCLLFHNLNHGSNVIEKQANF